MTVASSPVSITASRAPDQPERTPTDLSEDLVETLLVDVVRRRASRGEGAALAAWLTGRAAEAPTLAPWL